MKNTTKTNKITIKRNSATIKIDSTTGSPNWRNIRFNVVNLTTGEQLLESKWGRPAKGDKIADMLPYYAAAAALAECQRINGRITNLVNDILNDDELARAAAAVHKTQAELAEKTATYNRIKKAAFNFLDSVATAAASRRFKDNATDDEIAAAVELIEKCDRAQRAFELGGAEMFADFYREAVTGMTDAPDVSALIKAADEKRIAATHAQEAKTEEQSASDIWALNYYN